MTDFARQAISDRLLNDRTIWSDANGNILEITAVELSGDAASNVRKGKRILTYALRLKVTCAGCRNGARLRGVLESVESCHRRRRWWRRREPGHGVDGIRRGVEVNWP